MAALTKAEPKLEVTSSGSTARRIMNAVNSRLWKARSFFGGLLAIALAALGQQSVLVGNSTDAGQLYTSAVIVLIASMLHPRLPARENRAAGNPTSPAQNPSTWVAMPATTLPVRVRAPQSGVGGRGSGISDEIQNPKSGRPLGHQNRGALWATKIQNAIGAFPLLQSGMLRWQSSWRLAGAGLGVVLLLSAASIFVLLKSISDPLGGWLWAAALVILLLASIITPLWPRAKSLLPSPTGDFFVRGLPDIPRRWEAVLIGGILVISLALRVQNLEYMPGIFGDEGERGMDARAINEGNPALLFGYGWWGVPNLYFYLLSFSLRIFGDNMVGDRMLSVISGVVAVWFVYKTGRLLWGPRAGLIAASMLAVSPLALQFSRLAGESTPTGTLWIAGAYYFCMALRYLRWSDWALSGILWGFSLYFYAAGKLIIPIIALLGVYCAVRWRGQFFKRCAPGFILLLLGLGLTFMPYALFSSQETPPWQSITGRAQETSIFSPWNQAQAFAKYGIPYDPSMAGQPLVQNVLSQPLPWAHLLFQQMRVTTEVIYRTGDPTPFYQIQEHGGSMLAPLWAAIALLGLAYGAWKFWDARYGLLSIMFWGGMLGAALTMDTPSVQRLAGAWPVLMLFPAVLLDRVFAAVWPLDIRLARRWTTVPIVGLLVFLAVDSYHEYFVHYASLCPYCNATTQARYVQALGQDYKVYQMGVGDPNVFFGYGSTRFAAKGVEGTDLAVPADFFPVTDNGGKGAAFLIYPHSYDYRHLVRLFYPGGEEVVVKGGDGMERFTSYRVTREQMSRLQTSHAIYTSSGASAGAPPVSRDEPNLGTERPDGAVWASPAGVTYPVSVTWQSGVVAPTYKVYAFQVEGTADAQLEIDGRNFPLNVAADNTQGPRHVEVVLAKGIHDMRLTGTLGGPQSRLSLRWSGTDTLSPITTTYLYNTNGRESILGGLSGEIGPLESIELLNGEDPFRGFQPQSRRNDPFFGFREATVAFGGASFLVRWRGGLNITSPGEYAFRLNSKGPSVLLVDGSIIGNPTLGESSGGSAGRVSLSAGTHQVEIRYAWVSGPAIMEWYWYTPDSQHGLVPTTVLIPAARSWLPSEMAGAPGAPGQQGALSTPESVFGAEAGLSNPQGIAIDRDGNLYVGDKGNGRIVAFSPDGKVLRSWGKNGNEQSLQPGEFLDMQDVAVSEDGIIAVTDFSARRVQLFDRQGGLVGVLDASALQAASPNGVAASTGRNFYVADTIFSNAQKLTLAPNNTLQAVQTVPVDEQNKLEQCLDVAVDLAGRIYVVDIRDRILRISPDGSITTYKLPVGKASGGSRLAISPDGSRLYMSDPDRKRVAILDTASGSLSYFGEAGSKPGQFGEPSGVAVGTDGRIYVLDRLNNNIQVFRPSK